MKMRYGFTLLEVLIVVFLIGILATVVVSNFGPANVNAENQVAQTQLRIIYAAANSFRVENNRFPTTLAELVKDPTNPNIGGSIQDPNAAGNWNYTLTGSANTLNIAATGRSGVVAPPAANPALDWWIKVAADGTVTSNF